MWGMWPGVANQMHRFWLRRSKTSNTSINIWFPWIQRCSCHCNENFIKQCPVTQKQWPLPRTQGTLPAWLPQPEFPSSVLGRPFSAWVNTFSLFKLSRITFSFLPFETLFTEEEGLWERRKPKNCKHSNRMHIHPVAMSGTQSGGQQALSLWPSCATRCWVTCSLQGDQHSLRVILRTLLWILSESILRTGPGTGKNHMHV